MDAPSLGIIVFLRFPKPGAPVKTRLAQTVGKKRACGMYKACAEGVLGGLEELVETLGRAKVRLYVFFSEAGEAKDVKRWIEGCLELKEIAVGAGAGTTGPSFPISYHPQKQTGCLGDRMVDAFSFVESQGHAWVGIVGTDVPDLSEKLMVMTGLGALGWDFDRVVCDRLRVFAERCKCGSSRPVEENRKGGEKRKREGAGKGVRAVLGPSVDGGFYMLLMSGLDGGFFEAHPDLFDGIKWSTKTVFKETSEALARAGIDLVDGDRVPCLRDVDTWKDALAWQKGGLVPLPLLDYLIEDARRR